MAHETDNRQVCYLHLKASALLDQAWEADFVFKGKGGSIGRANENDFVLPEERVSRNHAMITYENGDYFLTDQDSVNGTFVNDAPDRLEPGQAYRIQDDDRLRIGDCLVVASLVPADGAEDYEALPEMEDYPGSVNRPGWFPSGDEDEPEVPAEISSQGVVEERPPVSAMKEHMAQPVSDVPSVEKPARRISGTTVPTGFIPGQFEDLPDEELLPGSSSTGGPGTEPEPEPAPVTNPSAVIPSVGVASGPLEAGSAGEPPPQESFVIAPSRPQPVHFSVYHPTELKPMQWYTLLAYVHIPDVQDAVERDSQIRLDAERGAHKQRLDVATETIARGAEIVAIPELAGCHFNPPQARLLWLEDWHRLEFRLQASPRTPGFELGTAVNGRIAFYVGPILVAEVKLWAFISEGAEDADVSLPPAHVTSSLYDAVFVSYAHNDTRIVERLEQAYRVLGLEYLRDVRVLRSGQQWNRVLLEKIEEADIFQLFWSHAARQSEYVEKEWRHALVLDRPAFVRPVFWEKPLPSPPPELGAIHFAFLEQP